MRASAAVPVVAVKSSSSLQSRGLQGALQAKAGKDYGRQAANPAEDAGIMTGIVVGILMPKGNEFPGWLAYSGLHIAREAVFAELISAVLGQGIKSRPPRDGRKLVLRAAVAGKCRACGCHPSKWGTSSDTRMGLL